MSQDNNKVYSKEALFELAAANPNKTYLSIHENIYDITEFLDEHPGGEEVLNEHKIKSNQFRDATESFEDVGHSMDARDMMHKYQVGVLENKKEKSAKKEEKKSANIKSSSNGSSWTWIILPTLASIGLAIAYQFFFKKN